ncbi:MAG: hypothetical protein WCT24_00535 [Patescibacteria group bacterium]
MQIYLLIVSYLVIFCICVLMIGLFIWWMSLMPTRAPFIPISKDVLPMIIDALELKEGSYLVDLGCGDARVIEAAWKKEPRARFLGVDNALAPIVMATLRLRKYKASTITLKKQNIFKTDLTPISHVFTFLLPGLMDKILPKLEAELAPGTRVVSCDFQFSQRPADFIIDLHRKDHQLGRTLYVYIF